MNNRAFGSLVATYGPDLPTLINNFGEGNEVEFRDTSEGGLECEFVARVDRNETLLPSVECGDFDANVCFIATLPPNTPAPSLPPIATPVAGPTPAPTSYPPTAPGSCYTSLNRLDDDERAVTDTSVRRDYVLCRDTVFTTDLILVGPVEKRPLTLRENMYIWCGEIGGSSANNCTITGGTLLTAFPRTFDPPSNEYNNVLVQGITFRAAFQYAILIGQIPGDITFVDCIIIVSILVISCVASLGINHNLNFLAFTLIGKHSKPRIADSY